jgi:histidinol-phosphatase
MMKPQLNRYRARAARRLTVRVTISSIMAYAVELAGRAGRRSVEMFHAGQAVRHKPDGSEVTDADLAIEELIRADLARHAPDDGVLGEEHGEVAGRSGRRWVVDPISGTAYFTRHMPLFGNLLAYEDEDGSAIGIVNLPMQREMVVAGRGLGCFVVRGERPSLADGQRVRVDPDPEPRGALTLAGNQQTWSAGLVAAVHGAVALVGGVHHPAFYVATGRVRAAVLTNQGYDDLAPLPVIVAEAGGRITDLSGGPVLTGDGSAVLANADVHGRLLDVIGKSA